LVQNKKNISAALDLPVGIADLCPPTAGLGALLYAGLVNGQDWLGNILSSQAEKFEKVLQSSYLGIF
jgi:hypothetical protein